MAWVTPRTFVTGAILTAAQLNEGRDNFNFLFSPPKCSVSRSAVKSIANNTVTAYDFDQESYDTDAMHSTVTLNHKVTAKTAGLFLLLSATTWGTNGTGRRFGQFLFNAVTGFAPVEVGLSSSGDSSYGLAAARVLAVNDTVELSVFQTSGGSLNATCTMSAHFLSN